MTDRSPQRKTIWVAWERHRRTLELCRYFAFPLITCESSRSRPVRHSYFCCRTVALLLRHRPQTLIVQNPSVVLTFIACALKGILKYRLLVDTHNAGIIPEHRVLRRLPFLFRYFQRKADITIVTNGR